MRIDSGAGITSVRLHTEREGLGMVLGPLELTLMQALWDTTQVKAVTTKQLRLAVEDIFGRDVTLSTVSNTLNRLLAKGYVSAHHGQSGIYVYNPVMSEDELERWVIQHVLATLAEAWPSHLQELGIHYDCIQHQH